MKATRTSYNALTWKHSPFRLDNVGKTLLNLLQVFYSDIVYNGLKTKQAGADQRVIHVARELADVSELYD